MNDWVISRYASKNGSGGFFKPAITNRLDRNTSGIMTAGMSLKGLQTLGTLFKTRNLTKEYYAIVIGQAKEQEILTDYLVKDEVGNRVSIFSSEKENAKKIITEYECLNFDEEKNLSLLKVTLHTGKSHQIRAHLSFHGFPLLGDPKYGNSEVNRLFHTNGQFLLSYKIAFPVLPDFILSGKSFELSVPTFWPVQRKEHE